MKPLMTRTHPIDALMKPLNRETLPVGPDQNGLDEEVAELVWAMNRLPGIRTAGSCSGHGKTRMQIHFNVTDYDARGLLLLSRLLSHNYRPYWQWFRVVLDHKDTEPQVCWWLETKSILASTRLRTYAEDLAAEINDHVDAKVRGYNILLDKVRH